MRILITILTMLSLLLTMCAGSFTSTAQQQNNLQDPFAPGQVFARNLHPSAVIGSTPERRAAWEGLTPEQQSKALAEFRTMIEDLKEQNLAAMRSQMPTDFDLTLAFTGDNGQRLLLPAKAQEESGTSVETESLQKPEPSQTRSVSKDTDLDGLPQFFESAVADAFTPFYHISAGERSGTGFATFGNFVPQTVQQVFGSVPPISNYRVKPVGFRTDANGNQLGYLQLDYLTLWNRDDGLILGWFCEMCLSNSLDLAGFSISDIVSALTDHRLDNERSAVLIAAPVSGPNIYNLDPQAYKAYQFFTVAHEDTFTEVRIRIFPNQPVPAGRHIELGLSLSKHGTYPFNPDYFPILPSYIIISTYLMLDFLLAVGIIHYDEYLIYLFMADTAYFTCVVEHFQDQGGMFAATRINVGDVNNPINNSGFIQDTELRKKLSKMLSF